MPWTFMWFDDGTKAHAVPAGLRDGILADLASRGAHLSREQAITKVGCAVEARQLRDVPEARVDLRFGRHTAKAVVFVIGQLLEDLREPVLVDRQVDPAATIQAAHAILELPQHDSQEKKLP